MNTAQQYATLADVVEFLGVDSIHPRARQLDWLPTELCWGDTIPVVYETSPGHRVIDAMHWGMNRVSHAMGAAKIETASRRASWAASYCSRRCLVPFSATREDGPICPMGGVYDVDKTGVAVFTRPFDVLYRPGLGKDGHRAKSLRAPLLVPEAMWSCWLDPSDRDPDSFRDELLLLSAAEGLRLEREVGFPVAVGD